MMRTKSLSVLFAIGLQGLKPYLELWMCVCVCVCVYMCSCMCMHEVPWWLSDYEPACQCRRLRFNPWVGKSPWRRKWQPTPVCLPGKSHGQRTQFKRLNHHHHPYIRQIEAKRWCWNQRVGHIALLHLLPPPCPSPLVAISGAHRPSGSQSTVRRFVQSSQFQPLV